ncbi:MAG: hypothetical protein WD598_03125 [Acidimicrobiia bacterium]
MRRAGRLVVAITLVALCACGGGSSSDSASGKGKKNSTPAPTGISADDPGCRYIVAGTDGRATNPGGAVEYLNTAVAEPFACYDKVTFNFALDEEAVPTTIPVSTTESTASVTCTPAYTVEYREAPFGLEVDGKGVPTSVASFDQAKAVLYVELAPAISVSTYGARPELAYPGNLKLAFKGMHHVVMVEWVKNLPEGEQTPVTPPTVAGVAPLPQRVVWLIGLDRKRPFTVDCATGPPPGTTCQATACTHMSVLIMK